MDIKEATRAELLAELARRERVPRLAQTGELSKVWRSKRDRADAAEVAGL